MILTFRETDGVTGDRLTFGEAPIGDGQVLIRSGRYITGSAVGVMHDPVTVVDSASINFTLVGQQLTGEVLLTGITHNLLSAVHPDTVTANVVRGDVVIGNATPAWQRLPIGADGTYLRSNGADVSWSAIQGTDFIHNLLSITHHGDTIPQDVTRGALIVGIASPEPSTTTTTVSPSNLFWSRLDKGEEGQYLRAYLEDIEWCNIQAEDIAGVQLWTRAGTTLSPTTAGDDITTTGVITGNSFITASNIGIAADTDLIQLTGANAVTMNGALTLPTHNIILSTGYVDSKAYYYIDGNKFISRDGTNCLLIGVNAGAGNTGLHVVAFGDGSGGGAAGTNTGNDNLFLGYLSGNVNTSGQQNAFIGTYTGRTNTIGSYNLFLATNAGLTNLSGSGNVAMGFDALYTNSTGNYNVAIGYQAGRAYLGAGNVFIGFQAGLVTTGVENVFIGDRAGTANVAGRDNTFIGMFAGRSNVSGNYITCVGRYAGQLVTSNFGTFIGRATGFSTTGANNTMVGASAGYYQGTGTNNVFIGMQAGQGSGAYNASNNVFLGYQAGYYETGSSKLFIDNTLRASEADGRTKALIYGIFAAAIANQLIRLNGILELTSIKSGATQAAAGAAANEVWKTASHATLPDNVLMIGV